MNRYVAYSDESYITAERYRSIASFSFPERFQNAIDEEIEDILDRHNIKEFKWNRLKSAQYRFCALGLSDLLPHFIHDFHARADVLIWDTQDARHAIEGRNDTENYERMYFHLHNHVTRERGNGTFWQLFPDEKQEIDWDCANNCLNAMGLKENLIHGNTLCCISAGFRYSIERICQIQSHECPCCQIADFLAGLTVFSVKNFEIYSEWAYHEELTESLFSS